MKTETLIQWVELHPWLVDFAKVPEPTWTGMAPSEILAMLATLDVMGIDHVVESGRHGGVSTEALAAYGAQVDSVDFDPNVEWDSRLHQYENLKLWTGNGLELAPDLVRLGSALVLDGPKGLEAIMLVDECLGISVAFLHDFHKGEAARRELEGEPVWYSDDPLWLEFAKHLDVGYWRTVQEQGTAWRKGPHTSGGGSYGPTLAVWVLEE